MGKKNFFIDLKMLCQSLRSGLCPWQRSVMQQQQKTDRRMPVVNQSETIFRQGCVLMKHEALRKLQTHFIHKNAVLFCSDSRHGGAVLFLSTVTQMFPLHHAAPLLSCLSSPLCCV